MKHPQMVVSWVKCQKTGAILNRLGCGHSKITVQPIQVGAIIECRTCGVQK